MADNNEHTPLLSNGRMANLPGSNEISINTADTSDEEGTSATRRRANHATDDRATLTNRRPASTGAARRGGGYERLGEDIEEALESEEEDKEEVEARLINAEFDSLDYDNCENQLFLEEAGDMTHRKWLQKQFARWVVYFLVGVLTGLTAALIDFSISKLSGIKFRIIRHLYEQCTTVPGDCMLLPLLMWLAWNIPCALIASLLTAFVEPVAAGSGIPQVKCFLNGVKIPRVVRIKTLVVKVVGVILSVLGGLAIGKEGPMIHSGAVIAAGISQGRSTTFGFDLKIFEYFRTDTEKRDFVSGGAAAGVSAAFGAPIGGVLFSLEEGASFWNQGLTWRIFFASVVSTFTLTLFKGFFSSSTEGSRSAGLVNFGTFEVMVYQFPEMPAYIAMAVLGGLFGAAFNYINIKLAIYRRRYVRRAWKQVLEVTLIVLVTTLLGYLMILGIPDCHPRGTDPNANQIQMYCSDGSVSSMAILWFQSPEESVKSLFHDQHGAYQPFTLGIFALFYFFLACWTYGSSVPSGLFIPGLVIGAAWGRLLSIACLAVFPGANWVDPGKFALIGAAAQLGGIVRMTLSLTVIIIEATGNTSLGLPIMIVLMVAKWVGDLFTEGIYDMHIELQGVPLLAWEPPPMTSSIMAREVMSYPVTTLCGVEKVSRIVDILTDERHDGFPIVHEVKSLDGALTGGGVMTDSSSHSSSRGTFGLLSGTITRSQLIVLLRLKNFVDDNSVLPKVRLRDFRSIYPRFPKIQDVEMEDSDLSRYIDLRPYMNPAPYSVFDNTSLPRIFKLFRGLGLRHLVVVNKRNEVIGIVTRKDLARYKYTRHGGQVKELQMTTGHAAS